MFIALFSALKGVIVPSNYAFTGEVSIKGLVLPVGGVKAKVEAAKEAGVKKVFIPKDNYNSMLEGLGIDVKPISTVNELIEEVFGNAKESICNVETSGAVILTAESIK